MQRCRQRSSETTVDHGSARRCAAPPPHNPNNPPTIAASLPYSTHLITMSDSAAAAAAAASSAPSANAPLHASAAAVSNSAGQAPTDLITTAINTTNTLLPLFTQQAHVRTLYSDAAGRYLTAVKSLKSARLSLEKFKQTCNRTQQLSLPRSMQLNLITRAKLPTVEDKPNFNEGTISALHSIEATATKATYDALVAAKERHIAHLEQCANAQAFIHTAVSAHRTHVIAYAAKMDSSLAFPVEAAVQHFNEHLLQRITELNMQAASEAMHEQATAQQARIDDSKAQETVLAGASTGATIAKLAERAVLNQLEQRVPHIHERQRGRMQREEQAAPPSAADDTPIRHNHSTRHDPSSRHAPSRGHKRDNSRNRHNSEQKKNKSDHSDTSHHNSSTSHDNRQPGKFVFRIKDDFGSNSGSELQHTGGNAPAFNTPHPDSPEEGSHNNRNSRPNVHPTNSRGGGAANKRRSQQPTPRRHTPAQRSNSGPKQH